MKTTATPIARRAVSFALALLFVATSPSAFALTETVNGVEWTYSVVSGEAIVGGGTMSTPAIPKAVTNDIVIPAELGGIPVTEIADYAFYGRTVPFDISIPPTVTRIGDGAFSYSNMSHVHVSDLTTWCRIQFADYDSNPLCFGATLVVNGSKVRDLAIPSGVAEIGDYALYGTQFESVSIPNSVTNIGLYAFAGSSIKKVSIGTGLTQIDATIFDCAELGTVTFAMGEGPLELEGFPVHSTVLMESDDVQVFRGWVDEQGNPIDIGSLSVATKVWPKWGTLVKISDVTADQRFPWNGLVDIECTVTGIEGATNGLKLAVAALDQATGRSRNGSHFQVERGGVWSDDREVTTNGTYSLLWDARADLGPVIFENVVVQVSFDAHEKVQLWEGGPYWATTNIGAEKPEDCGYYFWWGDTVGYKWENNAWVASDGSSSRFAFCSENAPTYNKSISSLKAEGWISADGQLAPEHDAAQVQWGQGWRMPTEQEIIDLCHNKCDWTRTTMNAMKGYVVRGRGDYASASIFLPAAGFGYGSSRGNFGFDGKFWSVHPSSGKYNSGGMLFSFNHSYEYGSQREYNYELRNDGFSIRPVQECTD